MNQLTIASRSNPWVQQWLRWQNKSGERKAAGVAWLEGEHLVKEALQRADTSGHVMVLQLVFPDNAAGRVLFEVLKPTALSPQTVASVVWLSDVIYKQLCSLNSSPGVCAVVRLSAVLTIDYTDAAVVLDGLQDPGNVGTVLRLCAAFGVKQVVLSQGCASAWGGKALRAGQGAQLAVNVVEDADLTQVYARFKTGGVTIAATSLQQGSLPLDQFVGEGMQQKMVWVFGHEGQGIGAITQSAASSLVHIPMKGGFESLNVASAAAICLWQWSQIKFKI